MIPASRFRFSALGLALGLLCSGAAWSAADTTRVIVAFKDRKSNV